MGNGIRRKLAALKGISVEAYGADFAPEEARKHAQLRQSKPRTVAPNSATMALCKIFRKNVKELLRLDGRSMSEISRAIGSKQEEWLRRIASKGLARRTIGNEPRLLRLAEIFKIEIGDFWDPQLESQLDKPLFALHASDQEKLVIWRKHVANPVFEKLDYLLATRRFKFLRNLIEAAYETEIKINPRPRTVCRRCHLEFENTQINRFGVCVGCGE